MNGGQTSAPGIAIDVKGLTKSFGGREVVHDLSMQVKRGSIYGFLGPNGSGKTTTIRSIMGLTPARSGAIRFAGEAVRGLPSYKIAKLGIGLVPEGRQIFPNLTVRENLVAASGNRLGASDPWTIDKIHALFPRLAERTSNMGVTLSGGEQQMLAIGRALMSRPRLLMLDEPSLGLAPLIARQIFDAIRTLNRQDGLTVLIVEQNANHALKLAHRGYVMVNGNITLQGTGRELLANEEVRTAYLEGGH